MNFKFYYPPDYNKLVDHICYENLTHYIINGLSIVKCTICRNIVAQTVVWWK